MSGISLIDKKICYINFGTSYLYDTCTIHAKGFHATENYCNVHHQTRATDEAATIKQICFICVIVGDYNAGG